MNSARSAVRYAEGDDRAAGFGSSYEGILCASLEHSVGQMPGSWPMLVTHGPRQCRGGQYLDDGRRACGGPAADDASIVFVLHWTSGRLVACWCVSGPRQEG